MPDGPALPFSGDAALNRGARLPSRPPDDHSQPPLADIIPGLAEARLRRPCHLQAASRRCSPPEAFPSRSVPPPFFTASTPGPPPLYLTPGLTALDAEPAPRAMFGLAGGPHPAGPPSPRGPDPEPRPTEGRAVVPCSLSTTSGHGQPRLCLPLGFGAPQRDLWIPARGLAPLYFPFPDERRPARFIWRVSFLPVRNLANSVTSQIYLACVS